MHSSSEQQYETEGRFNSLSWATDPGIAEECFSDWSIAVFDRVYYVHKVVMAIGPRHSEYFASLFKCGMSSEQHSKQSRLDSLSAEEIDALPLLLNFMYGQDHFLNEAWGNESLLIGLCKLGQYLLVPALLASVASICRQKMPLENLMSFTSELKNVLQDMELFYDATVSVIVSCSSSINVDTASKIHPTLFIRAMHKAKNASFEMFSDECILTSMEHHRFEMTEESFDFLGWRVVGQHDTIGDSFTFTSGPSLFSVSKGKAAMRLLLLSADVVKSQTLTRVQNECIAILARPLPRNSSTSHVYEVFSMSSTAERFLSRLPMNVLVSMMSRVVDSSQSAYGLLRAVMAS